METDQQMGSEATKHRMMYGHRKPAGMGENVKERRDPETRGGDDEG
jgi:hypothetical protein